MRTHLALVIFSATVGFSFAASPEPMTLREALRKSLLLVAVPPDYHNAVRSIPIHHPGGNGVFDLRFDYETGRPSEVHVVQSTGQPQLDGCAIAALKLWKAKPRSIHTLRVPLVFRSS